MTHIMHVEDNFLYGNGVEAICKINEMSVYMKVDGNPAFIYGTDPENGKKFITTKNLFSKKTPEVFYEGEFDDENAFKICLENIMFYLNKLNIPGVVMGDFIFNRLMKKTNPDDSISFKPNTIKYTVKKTAAIYNAVKQANIGIVFHSCFEGDTLSSMKKTIGVDISGFGTNKDIFYMDAELNIGKILTDKQVSSTNKILSQLNALDFKSFRTTIRTAFIKYVNNKTKKGEYPSGNLLSFINSASFSDKMIQHIIDHEYEISKIIIEYSTLIGIKTAILNIIDWDVYPLSATEHEGLIVTDHKKTTVKLVNRPNFSYQNFERYK